jgi:hypothetical protein
MMGGSAKMTSMNCADSMPVASAPKGGIEPTESSSMARAPSSKGLPASAYKSAGRTRDGVRVVKSKIEPKNFTQTEIKRAVEIAISELQKPKSKPKLAKAKVPRVQQRPDGMFAVEMPGKSKASAKKATQKEALARAKELEPGSRPIAKRVRSSKGGRKGTWRQP